MDVRDRTPKGFHTGTEVSAPQPHRAQESWKHAADRATDEAIALSDAGNHRESAALLERARRRFPRSVHVLLQLSAERIHLHEHAEALHLTEHAVRMEDFDHVSRTIRIGIHLNAAIASHMLRDHATAHMALAMARAIDRHRSDVEFVFGFLSEEPESDSPEAAGHYVRALTLAECERRFGVYSLFPPITIIRALARARIPRDNEWLHYFGAAAHALVQRQHTTANALLLHLRNSIPLPATERDAITTLSRQLFEHNVPAE